MFEKVGDIPSHHRCQVPTVDRSVSHRPADFVPSVVESGAAAATQQHVRIEAFLSVERPGQLRCITWRRGAGRWCRV
jgi:hypothetical protein